MVFPQPDRPRGRHRLPLAAVAIATAVSVGFGLEAHADPYEKVLLRALDKVTARTVTLEVPINVPLQFRTLQITASVCDKRPPEERPEAAAYLDIVEQRAGKPPVVVFRGWMFASSPGLSAMQHPVYDVWVLDCLDKIESAPFPPPDSPLPDTGEETNDALTGSASSNR